MPQYSFSSYDGPQQPQMYDNESTEMLAKPYTDKESRGVGAGDASYLPTHRSSVKRKVSKKLRKSFRMPDLRFWQRKNAGDQSPRTIYINEPERNQQQKFIGNRVSTAKYNIITFLPIFLYVEFSKAANIFFLFISCIQVW